MKREISKEEYLDLYENAPFGYFSINMDRQIVAMNTTLLNWLALEKSEVIGVKSIQDIFPVAARIYLETHLVPLLEVEEAFSEVNLELFTKEGKRIPVLVNGKLVKSEKRKEARYRFSVLDISQRKRFEMELIQAKKRAEEKSNILQEFNTALEQFAYTASHDLQAPLTTITGLLGILNKRGFIPEESEEATYFNLINKNLHRMKLMISDLLAYSKIDNDSAEMEKVALKEICEEAQELLSHSIRENNAVFELGELPSIMGNKIQLLRLFENLFSNALKYRSDEDPKIKVWSERSPSIVTVYVQDNGLGFEQEYAEKIFEFMQRLHRHDEIPGTGIGLASCKKIVQAHGGEISVRSEKGKGSTFFFTFPLT
ncbi:MAG: sensor histidine kinase [Bacteroidota bacterium]